MNAKAEKTTAPPMVGLFHQILMWPLLIKDKPESSLDEWEAVLKGPGSQWKPISHEEELTYRWDHYEEVVYFHPFVRDFLYGDADPDPEKRPVRLFKRADVVGVRTTFWDYAAKCRRDIDLAVADVTIFLFESRVALLVVEVWNGEPDPNHTGPGIVGRRAVLTLSQVLEIQDCFRRAYPPYWYQDKDGRRAAGHCPMNVVWKHRDGHLVTPSESVAVEKPFRDFVKTGAEPPVFEHWKELMKPLVPYKGEGGPKGPENTIAVQQIEDERIPSLSFVGVDRPRDLSEGDFVRLTFLDGAGDSATLPYSRRALKDFESEYCYDLFWDPRPATPADDWLTTRYMCCGYSFTLVGKSDDPFFSQDGSTPGTQKGALYHFRHHYFKMGLIAHFHRAALLMFSDRLSEAVKAYVPDHGRGSLDLEAVVSARAREEDFRDQVERIQEDLLRFRSRFWFTELSNQMQARALFVLWTKHLGTQDLFDQVLDETRTINAVLDSLEQDRRTKATTRLTVVATIGLLFSLVLAGLQVLLAWGLSQPGWSWAGPLLLVVVPCLLFIVISQSDYLNEAFAVWSRQGARQARECQDAAPNRDRA